MYAHVKRLELVIMKPKIRAYSMKYLLYLNAERQIAIIRKGISTDAVYAQISLSRIRETWESLN